MDTPAALLRTLNEIERVLACHGDTALRDRLRRVREAIRQLDQENEDLALENALLRRQVRPAQESSPASQPESARPELSPLPFVFTQTAASEAAVFGRSQPVEPLFPGSEEESPRLWHITHFFQF